MPDENVEWFMRLTIQNSRTGKEAFAMYPCEKYAMLESLDSCGVPYGGDYTHLAESYNRVKADSLQRALAGVIEHKDHPPAVQELNYLGTQIQGMSKDERLRMERELAAARDPTIVDAINLTHRLLGQSMAYDGVSMAGRAVSLESNEPYVRVQLYNAEDSDTSWEETETLWMDCPVSQADLETAAQKLGAASCHDVGINGIDSVIEDLYELADDMVTIDEINSFAEALRKNNVAESLGKYKAVLRMECCYNLSEATGLAASLDDYEFYPGETMESAGTCFQKLNDPDFAGEEVIDDIGFEETEYGVIRKMEDHTLEQGLDFGY